MKTVWELIIRYWQSEINRLEPLFIEKESNAPDLVHHILPFTSTEEEIHHHNKRA